VAPIDPALAADGDPARGSAGDQGQADPGGSEHVAIRPGVGRRCKSPCDAGQPVAPLITTILPPTAFPDTSGPPCQAQPSLPARAIWLGLAGVLLGGILASVLQVVSAAVLPGITSASIMLGEVGLWCGLGGSCVVASRRFGTGSLIRDLGWRIRLADLGLGPLAGIACVLTAGYLTSAFRGTNLAGSNTDIITDQRGTTIGVIVVTVIAAIGAPVCSRSCFSGGFSCSPWPVG
jgi:hypothetical protein